MDRPIVKIIIIKIPEDSIEDSGLRFLRQDLENQKHRRKKKKRKKAGDLNKNQYMNKYNSLGCTPEANTTSLINYISIQNKKCF